ncbi:MAG: uroporphyrinogen decarboxylase family protein [Armatimonadota bacterium]|nr:uroporphyrinogen decarboxylase family protein [Armatimonadota bacterium]MCX7777362.1 uroporphyrinogen decarboxylase family protein [Armatimonadota bacterium]MDW8025370.1 uroporphyrinogen decarboxylase family protein [Armatimonadota bacterium]
MTSRERLLCAFSCGSPDRIPVSPQGLGRLDKDGELARLLIERTDIIIYAGSACNCFIGSEVKFDVETDGALTTITYHTPKGDIKRLVKSTGITRAAIEFPCKSPDDVEKLLSITYVPPSDEEFNAALANFNYWKDRVRDEGVVLWELPNAICFPAEWFSPQDFCLLWADAPDAMIELVSVANERLMMFVERACKAGVDGFRIIGGEYASVQLGPKAFDILVRQFDKRLVALMHEYGAIAYYHNHGPIMRYLGMIADIGVDALDPLESPPWGDCNLAEAKRLLRGKVCIVGNMDDMEVLNSKPPEVVLSIGRELIEVAGPDGFVLSGTASGTYGERAALNFLKLVELAEEMSSR